ncbi:serine threonine-protein kinase BRI1-like [Seminavis robusta]|uniref:Serine threonine-protein kinase BRI1-like n=1 Tax=Seminavis robusta TaxID=568900 RepID=A0A9N8HIA5_9STRA|nr:serine threonine-protein kinase BRI1-like [Seminavis robusta]|eukprot:Sro489_g153270.1 serine threonine-protein kinase BRI1-like (676) ;mRNA; r:25388-27903
MLWYVLGEDVCTGEVTTCESVYNTKTCTEVDGNPEQCAAETKTCESVCERDNIDGYDSPCWCNQDFQGCDGNSCDYAISCSGTINCADFDNPVHCSVTRGCKWGPPAPTIPPAERSAVIQQYLVDQGVSTLVDLETTGSPQNRALTFLAANDTLRLEPPQGGIDTIEGYEFVTRYAFSVLFFSTLGPTAWLFDCNFLEPTSICFWYDILQYQDGSTELRGVFCDQTSGQPRALFLNRNELQGSLPAELGFVTTLTDVDFDHNDIGDSIPDTFQQMTNLTNLFVADNRLQGPIPAWIGNITNLKNINLSFNHMTGGLPLSLGTLENLEGLALDYNLFTSDLDVIESSDMPSLEQLYLENNQFTGALGDQFLKEMTNLKYLDISDNYIDGSIPPHLFTMPAVKVLDLHDNEFTAMPTFFNENNIMQLLALQKNQLKGFPVPTSINELKGLKHLDLSQNEFTGEIPATIGSMSNLTYLFLAQNDFEVNSIPSWIEGLTKLQELSLKSTQRTGPIPSFLGDLTSLILLDLDNNNLVGTIPASLGDLWVLRILLLNRNNLTSVIPDTFANLMSLKLMFLDANDSIEGNLGDLFCDNPNFAPRPPVLIASCDICNITPGCCALCCEGTTECNTGIYVPDLDPIWQNSYQRTEFTFGRDDYVDKNRTLDLDVDNSTMSEELP